MTPIEFSHQYSGTPHRFTVILLSVVSGTNPPSAGSQRTNVLDRRSLHLHVSLKWPLDLFVWLLFYAMATVFQLYHGGDMTYEKEKVRAYTSTDSRDL